MGHFGEDASQISSPNAEKKEKVAVSSLRLAANRQNALKSTGPKTARGKAFSRMNAWKHGLFARQFSDFRAHGESPTEYSELLEGLRDHFQPVGCAEELEVELIAQCWWKRKRCSRYENAVNRVALRDLARKEVAAQDEYCKKLEEQEKAAVQLLQSAEGEIEAAGKWPPELKERISVVLPGSEVMWPGFEIHARELLSEAVRTKMVPRTSPKSRDAILAQVTACVAIRFLEYLPGSRAASVKETAIGQHVIPNRDSLDRLLRYEAAIDRHLGRALDRLYRLQRRRHGIDDPAPSTEQRKR